MSVSVLSRRLRGATNETDISLQRLGIRAKDFNGAIQELATRGGNSAEAMKKASGGMVDFENSIHHTELAIGRVVNAIRIPFLTALTGTGFEQAKQKLEGVAKTTVEVGEAITRASEEEDDWIVKLGVAAAVTGHVVGNVFNVVSAIVNTVKATLAFIAELEVAATAAVVNGVEKMTQKAIDALAGLAKFSAQTAHTLSAGILPDVSPQIDAFANKARGAITSVNDDFRKYLLGQSDDIEKTFNKALADLEKAADRMSKGGPKLAGNFLQGELINPEFINRAKQQIKDLRDYVSGVTPGSRVVPPGDDAGKAAASKAATDALTQSKFQLANAELTYKNAVEETKLLEESGQITHAEADARNNAAIRDYIAEIERAKVALPGLIAQLEAVGNTKGAAEAKLQLQQLSLTEHKLESELGNTTVFGKIRSQIRQLANDWADVGKQVGGFLTQQFQNFASGAGNAIGALIFRTGNWKQAILQIGQSFVSSLATMVIQWVLARTVMSALNKAFGAADSAATNAQATGAAAAWSPAAIAASIASSGAAAGLGLAAYLAAIASGTAGTIAASAGGGTFQVGGFTGHGPEHRPAGIVHFEEVVFPAPRVRELGRDWLVNLAVGNLTKPGYQRGGFVGSRSDSISGGRDTGINIAMFDDRQALEQFLRSAKGRTIVYEVVSNRKWEI